MLHQDFLKEVIHFKLAGYVNEFQITNLACSHYPTGVMPMFPPHHNKQGLDQIDG